MELLQYSCSMQTRTDDDNDSSFSSEKVVRRTFGLHVNVGKASDEARL